MARKAARGAGYAWGVADEAGAATRWLCARGLDGCAALASLLDMVQNVDLEKTYPELHANTWRGRGGALCPIHAGLTARDRASLMDDNHLPLELENVMAPTLVLPFAAGISGRIDGPVSVDTGTAVHVVAPDALDPPVPLRSGTASLQIACSDVIPHARPAQTRARPDPAAWEMLTRFAHRTYAPATDASRARGAGGDLPDTD